MAQFSATVLIVGLPDKAFVGFDLIALTASPQFLGINEIPPGLHFIYAGTDSALSIRQGIWIHVWRSSGLEAAGLSIAAGPHAASAIDKPASATNNAGLVLRWDTANESLMVVALESSQEEQSRAISTPSRQSPKKVYSYQELIHRTQASSGATRQGHLLYALDDWSYLTDHLTQKSLSRILLSAQVEQPLWTLSSGSAAPCDQESIPGLEASEAWQGRDLKLLHIDLRQTWPADSYGIERTTAARDRSWRLQSVVRETTATTVSVQDVAAKGHVTDHDGEDHAVWGSLLIGELQFCFLMIVLLMNYSCLQQWRRILEVVLTSKSIICKQPLFFRQFLRSVRLQILNTGRVDGGLFDVASNEDGAFLTSLILRFRQNLDDLVHDFRDRPLSERDPVFSTLSSLKEDLSMLTTTIKDVLGLDVTADIVRRGTVMLEDGEMVDVQLSGADADDEHGEYAPVVV